MAVGGADSRGIVFRADVRANDSEDTLQWRRQDFFSGGLGPFSTPLSLSLPFLLPFPPSLPFPSSPLSLPPSPLPLPFLPFP